ncbi:EscR/YscR/HrcR family type III secretion system export apparatus protein [Martelella alba]|uniref:EscR/YscR/HrcR family type III secretion system export apparatus protein n=1 Tax=Martelella alba TaxID=2590451 RepID=A0ABY2SJE3_9HYPH|nr:EscR/YscR/HrcR family type III secretion system export apparatus protein [Martelella alba]TKI05080.1 EscR/YscR/HrcR family type III secretion system export apparatus protein [Martelella alba]
MISDIGLIGALSFLSLLPFLIASGTCYVKFSIVFVMVRNALGLQQVPSNMTLNGVALLLALFIMAPVARDAYQTFQEQHVDLSNPESVVGFMENGLDGYKDYLRKYTDPELARFFEKAQSGHGGDAAADETSSPSMLALLPAYALSEIKSAFKIGFYLYLPFVVVDLLISSVLLALGMMMMSPITISVPIKLILFVVLDGWTLLSKGLVLQYIDLAT